MYPLPLISSALPRDGAFKCRYCPVDTVTYSTWFFHMLSHVGIYQYPCPHCPYRAMSVSSFRGHLEVHAVASAVSAEGFDGDEGAASCSGSSSASVAGSSSASAQSAQASALAASAHVFQCGVCSYASPKRNWLTLHTKAHVDDPLQCFICHLSFGSRRDLFRHLEGYHVAVASVPKTVVKHALGLYEDALRAADVPLRIARTPALAAVRRDPVKPVPRASGSSSSSSSPSKKRVRPARVSEDPHDDSDATDVDEKALADDVDDGGGAVGNGAAAAASEAPFILDTLEDHNQYCIVEAAALSAHEPYMAYLSSHSRPSSRTYDPKTLPGLASQSLDKYYRLESIVPEFRVFRWQLQARIDTAVSRHEKASLEAQMRGFMYTIAADRTLDVVLDSASRSDVYWTVDGLYRYVVPVSVLTDETDDAHPSKAVILTALQFASESCDTLSVKRAKFV